MAITNHERVNRAMESLRVGLMPFVSREFINHYRGHTHQMLQQILHRPIKPGKKPFQHLDAAALLLVMWESWNEVYRKTLGHAERSLVSELRDVRNRWAHQQPFSGDDAYRALDSAHRLLTSVSAPQAAEVEKAKMELMRVRFSEQARTQRRKTARQKSLVSSAAAALTPWRQVVVPHKDVASGRYERAEFAADLWQVYIGKGSSEYRDPGEFFRRTYLTASLTQMLGNSMRRLCGAGGDPVVQLQTNFGGGKTHSLLALFHLFSGASATDLSGVDELMQNAGISEIPKVNRVVLVGNKISPGNPAIKPDGTQVRTLWGELAWQLGHEAGGPAEARRAYERVRADDEQATNPGDVLRELLNQYGPSLILIDEWVAYARQLHDEGDLPAGSFETQFTFAQALSESAKLAGNCLLVISLPASDTRLPASDISDVPPATDALHIEADDVEVGGLRGRAALNRLRNVIGRVESSWRPASAEESFEIVRRRLFQPILEVSHFTTRDNVARAFCDFYSNNHQEFPPECVEPDYEKRIKAAYPIHPEVFERLYSDWSTLPGFQRTRGVLRLMAAVIHDLWENGDRNPLVLPADVAVNEPLVQFELTRYLPDNWIPVIERDIDGEDSLPKRLDNEISNLGKYAACRRVARSVYLGSAPIPAAANKGIEDRRIKLGCVIPGEPASVFGDALRRLGAAATFLYQDGSRYWYSTQPTVARLAEDRAEQNRRHQDKVNQEIKRRLQFDLRSRGDFKRIHIFPVSSHDVQDDSDAGLVVLSPASAHTQQETSESRAIAVARSILESRGKAPRLFRNTLVFLAADSVRLQDLEDGVRRYLAWQSILAERDTLDLPPHQVRQAEMQQSAAESVVVARMGETFQWLLVPTQATPKADIEWKRIRLRAQKPLAVRASRRMRENELLVTYLAGTVLRLELDRIPLWRENHVAVRQLMNDFARYIYLPRLKESAVLVAAVTDGLSPQILWEQDSFAYADSYDEAAGRYRGLHHGQRLAMSDSEHGLLVHPEAARKQLDAEAAAEKEATQGDAPEDGGSGEGSRPPVVVPPAPAPRPSPKRYHGLVKLDPNRVGPDASKIGAEVIAHLSGLVGSNVRLSLEIEADIPTGAPDHVVRVVIENSRSLKFDQTGFENE